jgi:AcrR family transcriptional regulator
MNLATTKPGSPVATSRRTEILAAAAALFAQHGFARVTVDDIGAALGISGPAIYHHFRSKEALLGEMLVSISEHLLARGAEIAAASEEPLAELVAHHADFAVDNVALITVQYRDLVHAAPTDQAQVRRLQRRYVELWVDALGAADRREGVAQVHAVFGLLNSTPHSGRLARTDMKALLTDMALVALAATARVRP